MRPPAMTPAEVAAAGHALASMHCEACEQRLWAGDPVDAIQVGTPEDLRVAAGCFEDPPTCPWATANPPLPPGAVEAIDTQPGIGGGDAMVARTARMSRTLPTDSQAAGQPVELAVMSEHRPRPAEGVMAWRTQQVTAPPTAEGGRAGVVSMLASLDPADITLVDAPPGEPGQD